MNRQKWSVPVQQKRKLFEALQKTAFCQQKAEQYCDWRLDIAQGADKVVAKQFSNGTFYMEGKPSKLWQALEAAVLGLLGGHPKTSAEGKALHQAPDSVPVFLSQLHAGQDESGKGDYFGGIVVAGVCLTVETQQQLQSIGVQDSKALSASEIQKLAKEIQQLLPDSQYTVLSLQPAEYNETYESFVAEGFSLNQMLGSLHAKVFEKLYAQNADLKGVIIDQFGKPQDVTRYVTPTLTKQVKFVFETKAEKYTAVAAASILARAAFVNQMNALNEAWKVKFPLGATHVLDAGRAFVRANGKNNLTEVAKVHFKTTQTVLQ